ncbi:hypothetical protein FYK55_25150 [Roseiconus nitratireducens]|uniref:Uncharacterized protein n=1 Tax=Roseiconus nitratireducens TaxID=2605748 RepID=A0A5M6CXR5_9BACT|nr:hypothetical protein [Roseiconus nitratireducens]KAA5539210.1 hypothetical protein FYK55_25150 [Roseiconus nitratireducens]
MNSKPLGVYSLAVALVVLAASTGRAADLTMRFVWEGRPPELEPIENPFAHDCREVDLNEGRQFVDAKSKGVRDVVAYVSPSRREREQWKRPPRNREVEIGVKDCRIQPHIVVAQAGDRLIVREQDDAVFHNLTFAWFANQPFSGVVPPKSSYTLRLRSAEPAPIPVRCNIHPWERAYVLVLEHEFVGVSDKDGHLAIRGLPKGPVTIRVWHEHGTLGSVRIGGERRPLAKGRLHLDLNDPVTDLGEVVIDAASFENRDRAAD